MTKSKKSIATVHANLAGIRDDVAAMNAALSKARPMIQQITELLTAISAMQASDAIEKDKVN